MASTKPGNQRNAAKTNRNTLNRNTLKRSNKQQVRRRRSARARARLSHRAFVNNQKHKPIDERYIQTKKFILIVRTNRIGHKSRFFADQTPCSRCRFFLSLSRHPAPVQGSLATPHILHQVKPHQMTQHTQRTHLAIAHERQKRTTEIERE